MPPAATSRPLLRSRRQRQKRSARWGSGLVDYCERRILSMGAFRLRLVVAETCPRVYPSPAPVPEQIQGCGYWYGCKCRIFLEIERLPLLYSLTASSTLDSFAEQCIERLSQTTNVLVVYWLARLIKQDFVAFHESGGAWKLHGVREGVLLSVGRRV